MARLSLVALLLVGCGASPPASSFDASTDATDAADELPPVDWPDCAPRPSPCSPAVDAAPPVGLVDGGGTFLCAGCPCDGRTHYCDMSSVGPPPPLDPDAGCVDAKRCKPYPAECGVAPSCSAS